jgi:hypothetical protein
MPQARPSLPVGFERRSFSSRSHTAQAHATASGQFGVPLDYQGIDSGLNFIRSTFAQGHGSVSFYQQIGGEYPHIFCPLLGHFAPKVCFFLRISRKLLLLS